MKKSEYPSFSNGFEFMWWMNRNCDLCWKSSQFNEDKGTYSKFRCAINREIIEAAIGDGTTSERTYKICRYSTCPYRQMERPKYPKKPKFDNQPKLFEV